MRHIIYLIAMAVACSLWSCEKLNLSGAGDVSSNYEPIDTCYVWNGHIVVSEQRSKGGTTELMLLSLYEWSDMPSANHVTDSVLASIVTKGYQETDLCEWHVPNIEEAKYMRTTYEAGSVSLDILNKLFSENDALVVSGDARYLCNEGHKSFSLASGTSISNAGSKMMTYKLRLMKRVVVR